MSHPHRIIENPLDYLRPSLQSSLVYFALLLLTCGAVAAIIQSAAPRPPVPAQPAGR